MTAYIASGIQNRWWKGACDLSLKPFNEPERKHAICPFRRMPAPHSLAVWPEGSDDIVTSRAKHPTVSFFIKLNTSKSSHSRLFALALATRAQHG